MFPTAEATAGMGKGCAAGAWPPGRGMGQAKLNCGFRTSDSCFSLKATFQKVMAHCRAKGADLSALSSNEEGF